MVFTIFSFDVACNSGSYGPSHNEYKLNFTINPKVKISKTALVPTDMYLFTPASDVFNDYYDNNYLVGMWLSLCSYKLDYVILFIYNNTIIN